MLYGSDSDVSAASDDEQEGPVRHAPTGVKNRKSQMRKAKKDEREGGGAYIQEGENEVLDLLDDRMMSRISGPLRFCFR